MLPTMMTTGSSRRSAKFGGRGRALLEQSDTRRRADGNRSIVIDGRAVRASKSVVVFDPAGWCSLVFSRLLLLGAPLRVRPTRDDCLAERVMSLLGDHRSLVDFMDRLLQELDSVRPNRTHSNPSQPPPPPSSQPALTTTTTKSDHRPQPPSKPSGKPPTMPASAVHHPSSGDAGVKVRPKPAVPPKPPMDSIRFSMATVEGEPLELRPLIDD